MVDRRIDKRARRVDATLPCDKRVTTDRHENTTKQNLGFSFSWRRSKIELKNKINKNLMKQERMEYLGVEPSASRMLSERSTDELEPHCLVRDY
jgi:hypothetical protein